MPQELAPGTWPVKVKPSGDVAENVTRMVRREYDRILRFEPGSRSGEDPENLHKMRVSVRRMRAATRVFRPMLDRAAMGDLRRDLRWLGDVLGQVRDRDTAIDALEKYKQEALPEDIDWIQALIAETGNARQEYRRQLLEALDSDRCVRFKQETETLLAAGLALKPGRDDPKLRDVLPGMIRKAWKSVQRTDRDIAGQGSERLHRLRLDCKNLRYLCEFVRPILRDRFDFLVHTATRVQDTVGRMRDCERDMRFFVTSDQESELPVKRRLHRYFQSGKETALAEFLEIWKRITADEFGLWVRYRLRFLERQKEDQ
ncbi:MAG: CHAD domain-containing protein [bacterium]